MTERPRQNRARQPRGARPPNFKLAPRQEGVWPSESDKSVGEKGVGRRSGTGARSERSAGAARVARVRGQEGRMSGARGKRTPQWLHSEQGRAPSLTERPRQSRARQARGARSNNIQLGAAPGKRLGGDSDENDFREAAQQRNAADGTQIESAARPRASAGAERHRAPPSRSAIERGAAADCEAVGPNAYLFALRCFRKETTQ